MMPESASHDVTQLLLDWRNGDQQALERLTPLVYDVLRRLARLGIVAACYQHYDHALAAFSIPAVRAYCEQSAGIHAEKAVQQMSQQGATLKNRLGWRLMRALQNRFA